jgi:DNA-binding NarL/FixJ family response regulator
MTRVFLVDAQVDERAALRLLLLDLKMEVVGEAVDWPDTLAQAPGTPLDMLLVDWDLLPANLGVESLAEPTGKVEAEDGGGYHPLCDRKPDGGLNRHKGSNRL